MGKLAPEGSMLPKPWGSSHGWHSEKKFCAGGTVEEERAKYCCPFSAFLRASSTGK